MAIATTSPLIGSISGRLASSVFANTNTGLTVRAAPRIIRHTSSQATKLKASLATAHNTWTDVDNDLYLEWRTYAERFQRTNRIGTRRPMTAHQMFLHQNILTTYVHANSRTTPMLFTSPFSIGSVTLTFTAGGTYYVLAEDTYPGAGWLLVAASRPVRSTPTRNFRNWRIFYDSAKASTPGNDVSSEFDNAFGAPAAGEVIGIAVRFSSFVYFSHYTPWWHGQVTMA